MAEEGMVLVRATGKRTKIMDYEFGKIKGYKGKCAYVPEDLAAKLTGRPVNCNFEYVEGKPETDESNGA